MSTSSGTRTLSESASAALLARFGVPLVPSRFVSSVDEAIVAASQLGHPVALKLSGDRIAHKTERGLVRLRLTDEFDVRSAGEALLAAARPEDGEVGLLVAQMVRGNRELIAGLATDEQFGTTVMVGVGGVLAEAIADVSIRLVPIEAVDAAEMLDELGAQALLGPFRGEQGLDRDAMIATLVALSDAAVATEGLHAADLNPLVICDGMPVAVDCLVELDETVDARRTAPRGGRGTASTASGSDDHDSAGFDALFDPEG
ncbi:MAG: acetate--CoA ligase family protein [Microthrixaceae bacterium]